jgi:thiamine-monophosphate kinase
LPLNEATIIDRFFRPLAGEGAFELRDDAARLTVPPGYDLVVTADMIAAGVHFLPADPADTIAKKALRVNLSDLAAKGARPIAYVLSIGLEAGVDAEWLAGFAGGLREDQKLFGVDLLGGDTIAVVSGPVISVTAFGLAPAGRMLHRFGGRPGDALYVSGMIGAAAAGLAVLRGVAGLCEVIFPADREALIARFRVPEPRLALAPALVEFASAAMDVSDGLVGDCDKLAAASGCGAVIEAERVPLPPGLADPEPAMLANLLTGGDDYEILAAVPPDRERGFCAAAPASGVDVARIGELTATAGPTEVLWRGRSLVLGARSYVHGRGRNENTSSRSEPETR